MNPERILGKKAYTNYRNVRAVAMLLAVLGALMLFGGTITAIVGEQPDKPDGIPRPAAIAMAILGLCGLVGGAATLSGNRKWARLSYVMAAAYTLAIPLGTILGIVLLVGLKDYLDSEERLNEAARRRRRRNEDERGDGESEFDR